MNKELALTSLATMYHYRAMYRKFADLSKYDDPEQAKVYARLARLGSKKIREAEAHGIVNLAELLPVKRQAEAEGERNALTEYFS